MSNIVVGQTNNKMLSGKNIIFIEWAISYKYMWRFSQLKNIRYFLIFKATTGSKYNSYCIAIILLFYALLKFLGTQKPNQILERNTISRSKHS